MCFTRKLSSFPLVALCIFLVLNYLQDRCNELNVTTYSTYFRIFNVTCICILHFTCMFPNHVFVRNLYCYLLVSGSLILELVAPSQGHRANAKQGKSRRCGFFETGRLAVADVSSSPQTAVNKHPRVPSK